MKVSGYKSEIAELSSSLNNRSEELRKSKENAKEFEKKQTDVSKLLQKELYVLKNEAKKFTGCSTPNCNGSGNIKTGKKTHYTEKNCPLVNTCSIIL